MTTNRQNLHASTFMQQLAGSHLNFFVICFNPGNHAVKTFNYFEKLYFRY